MILASRPASEDLGTTMSGRTHYSLTLDTARGAGDGQLAAIAHGYAAQLDAAEGLTTAALDQLTTAAEHATPVITSWLAATEATIHADWGDLSARARGTRPRPRRTRSQPNAHPGMVRGTPHRPPGRSDGTYVPPSGGHNGACTALTMALDTVGTCG
jgi:hypothetical protein